MIIHLRELGSVKYHCGITGLHHYLYDPRTLESNLPTHIAKSIIPKTIARLLKIQEVSDSELCKRCLPEDEEGLLLLFIHQKMNEPS